MRFFYYSSFLSFFISLDSPSIILSCSILPNLLILLLRSVWFFEASKNQTERSNRINRFGKIEQDNIIEGESKEIKKDKNEE